MTEATEVENPVVRWLKLHRIESYKMNGMGKRGYPDRMIFLPLYPLWLEFKRKDKDLRKLQVYRVKQMKELGYDVQTYDTKEEAIEAIKRALAARMEAARLSKESRKIRITERVCRIVFGSRTW